MHGSCCCGKASQATAMPVRRLRHAAASGTTKSSARLDLIVFFALYYHLADF